MKISVITVTYNSEEYLHTCIKSVLNQDYPDIEYIIIDGASRDKTIDIVQSYGSKITKAISEPDKGIYDAMNKGIKLASGDVIGILNSDDLYIDNSVISRVAKIFETSLCDAAYGDLVYVDNNNIDKIVRIWKSGKYKENSFLYGWMPPHPTFFVKKEIYKKYGLFNLSLKSAADYEIMLRFIHKNKIIPAYLPYTLIKMRIGGVSNASFMNRIKANLEDRKSWRINGLKPNFFTLFLKPIRKLTQFKIRK